MKFYKYLLMLPVALMAVSCSDEDISEEKDLYSSTLKSCTIMSGDYISWLDVEEIRYHFLNGSDAEKAEVRKAMLNWMAYGNIKFVEGDSYDNDLRIKFDYSLVSNGTGTIIGGTSTIGRDIHNRKKEDEAHMTLYPRTTNNLKALALHELGHVLGFGDEIFNKNCPVKKDDWNYNNIYRDFIKGGLSAAAAQQQVQNLMYNLSEAPKHFYWHNEFDEKSIMMYRFKPTWSNNGYSYKTQNEKLSEGDKKGIDRLYPLGMYVPVFVGTEGGNKAVLGRYDDFSSSENVREFVGYGFEKEQTGTYPVTRFVNKNNGEVRMGTGKKSGNTIVWDKNLLSKNFEPVEGLKPIYMYYSHGYGRTPVEVYYKNGEQVGYSYCFDSYLTSAGYTRPGSPLALVTSPKKRH
ncbi:MAG: hypothetical protein K6G31_02525 [Paludibacteraceae bacterium]|nr:hypothetical protein [Paludibacteraceae bacterium]